jgi:transposase InsO family protein
VVISFLIDMFTRHGIPDTVVTDYGKQFVSVEFERFSADCDIKHVKASLYYPQSYGLVERFNRSVKQAVRTALAEGKPVEEGVRNMLVTYRSTAQPATGVSPSRLCQAGRCKCPATHLLWLDIRRAACVSLMKAATSTLMLAWTNLGFIDMSRDSNADTSLNDTARWYNSERVSVYY